MINIETGKTYNHSNLVEVRVIQVQQRGVIVLQTVGREGMKYTVEHKVRKADLHVM